MRPSHKYFWDKLSEVAFSFNNSFSPSHGKGNHATLISALTAIPGYRYLFPYFADKEKVTWRINLPQITQLVEGKEKACTQFFCFLSRTLSSVTHCPVSVSLLDRISVSFRLKIIKVLNEQFYHFGENMLRKTLFSWLLLIFLLHRSCQKT